MYHLQGFTVHPRLFYAPLLAAKKCKKKFMHPWVAVCITPILHLAKNLLGLGSPFEIVAWCACVQGQIDFRVRKQIIKVALAIRQFSIQPPDNRVENFGISLSCVAPVKGVSRMICGKNQHYAKWIFAMHLFGWRDYSVSCKSCRSRCGWHWQRQSRFNL